MAEKLFNTRVQLKQDTWANWNNVSVANKGGNLVLKDGELAFCVVPSDTNENGIPTNPPTVLFKVGDGTNAFKDLEWGSALAADVYDWAKSPTKPSYTPGEVGVEEYQIVQDTSAGANKHAFKLQKRIKGTTDWIDVSSSSISFDDTDTNTTYQIVQDTTDGHKFKLQSKEKGATAWTDVNIITIPDNNTNQKVKAGNVTFGENDIVNFVGSGVITVTGDATADTITIHAPEVTAASLGLSSAMNFKGRTTTAISDGSTTKPIAIPSNPSYNQVAGDVVLYGNKEFIWDGTHWEEFGDEGSHLIDITASDDDVVVLAVSGTGTTRNIDGKHAKKGPAGGATKGATADVSISGFGDTGTIKIPKVIVDAYGHTTGLTEQTLTITMPAGNVEDLVQDADDIIVFNCGTSTTVI